MHWRHSAAARTNARFQWTTRQPRSIHTHRPPPGGGGASERRLGRRAVGQLRRGGPRRGRPLYGFIMRYRGTGRGTGRRRPGRPLSGNRPATADHRPHRNTTGSRLRLAGLNARSSDNQVDSTRHAAQRPTAKATSPPSPAQAETATSIRYTHAHSTLHTAVGVSALTCPRSYSLTVQGITGIVHTGG